MELILIRHGLPEKVINQDGTPADPPLSEEGLKQAELVANWLEHEQIDKLYASPMRRAVQTAEPLAKVKGLDIELREGVAEYDRKSDLYIPCRTIERVRLRSLEEVNDGRDCRGRFSRIREGSY
jgi:probable phosphoglycerate mutase